MAYKLTEVEGIGDVYAEKLVEAGITNTDEYFKAAQNPKGRKELAEKTSISEKLILEWANKADLMRIKGVAEEYADLLEASGVDTCKELKMRNAENLAEKMKEVNADKNLCRTVPGAETVAGWIEQAKQSTEGLEY